MINFSEFIYANSILIWVFLVWFTPMFLIKLNKKNFIYGFYILAFFIGIIISEFIVYKIIGGIFFIFISLFFTMSVLNNIEKKIEKVQVKGRRFQFGGQHLMMIVFFLAVILLFSADYFGLFEYIERLSELSTEGKF